MINCRNLTKTLKNELVLDNVSITIEPGSIVGLVGPNGAGKTTLIKALLGQARVSGEIDVLGFDPRKQRHQLMEEVAYTADVASIPGWMKVMQVIEYFEGVHNKFDRDKALRLLKDSSVTLDKKVKQLSKGMLVQLHLACVLAIDVKLLILDEPTLGLDILYRKQFYDQLISEFFDETRSIIITSHQIDEIERLLNQVIFINKGQIVLNDSIEGLAEKFVSLFVSEAHLEEARNLKPLHEKPGFGKHILTYKDVSIEQLEHLGHVGIPTIADLFAVIMREAG
jgi:ABC-2 type transport system ATP-binding protein